MNGKRGSNGEVTLRVTREWVIATSLNCLDRQIEHRNYLDAAQGIVSRETRGLHAEREELSNELQQASAERERANNNYDH